MKVLVLLFALFFGFGLLLATTITEAHRPKPTVRVVYQYQPEVVAPAVAAVR